jgi:hypothetical protein
MEPEKYDIDCLKNLMIKEDYNGVTIYDIFEPNIEWFANYSFSTYMIQPEEEGRIDLVMQSIYGVDGYDLKDLDVILYLNEIDNPLNILGGSEIIYVAQDLLSDYRYKEIGAEKTTDEIKRLLSVPNKTTRVDKNRQKFVDSDYSIPPVLNKVSTPPVQVTNDKIIIGGLK